MILAIAFCASVSYYGYCVMNRNRKILHEKRPNELKDLYPDKYKNFKN